jgi:phosphodiesterase/alkaline phosphatase D-like protein
MKKITLFFALLFGHFSVSIAQNNNIILGRPTDTTISASVMFDQSAQFYLQYGTISGNYTNTTLLTNAVANTPDEIDLKNLLPNTRYYYRMQYKLPSATN